MADLTNLEIARVGTWNAATGELTVTEQMLQDAADYGNRPNARPAPLRIGHRDPRFSGEPALGWLTNLRVEGAGEDAVLMGDVVGVPDWLARAAPSAWPDRSMEGWTDVEEGGRKYGLIVDGLALLGVQPPAMSSIKSLRDLPQALGVAASARVAAQFIPAEVPSGDAATKAPTAAEAAARIHNAPVRGATTPEEGEMQFTDEQLSELRTKLGIADDKELEPAMVLAAVSAPAEPSQAAAPEGAAPEAQPQDGKPSQPKMVAGTVTIDQGAWDEREERIRRLEAEAAKRRRDERDNVIATAVNDGKFPPSRAEHWQRLWDADPEGTRQVIDGLTRNVVPVLAMGFTGGPDDPGVDEEFAHLFPPTHASKGA